MKAPKFGKVVGAEEQEILRLLQAGHSAQAVARMTGRSSPTVARIRDVHGIPAVVPGSHPVAVADQFNGIPTPWIPAEGYDLYAEKPHQQQWLAMLAAASPAEQDRLRSAMCNVLDLSPICTDSLIVTALIADRRGADELAEAYMAARATGRGSP